MPPQMQGQQQPPPEWFAGKAQQQAMLASPAGQAYQAAPSQQTQDAMTQGFQAPQQASQGPLDVIAYQQQQRAAQQPQMQQAMPAQAQRWQQPWQQQQQQQPQQYGGGGYGRLISMLRGR